MMINFRGNMDDSLSAGNTFIAGSTGSGKSTYMKRQFADVKRKVFWDPDGSHDTHHLFSCREFFEELSRAMESGKPFSLGLQVANHKKPFQFFCKSIMLLATCEKPITVFTEEIQEVTGSADAEGCHKSLLTRGRKYGVTMVSISPRPQVCPKTLIASSPRVACGAMYREEDCATMERELGLSRGEINRLQVENIDRKLINMFVREPGKGTSKIKFEF